MKVYYYSVVDPYKREREVTGDIFRIGRNPKNDLVLDSPFVADEAAILKKTGNQWEYHVLGVSAVYLGDRQLYRGDRWLITPDQALRLPPFTLEFDIPTVEDNAARRARELDLATQRLVQDVHAAVIKRMRDSQPGDMEVSPSDVKRWEDEIERVADEQGLSKPEFSERVDHLAGLAVRSRLVEQLSSESQSTGRGEGVVVRRKVWSRQVSSNANRETELENTCRHFGELLKFERNQPVSDRLAKVERECLEAWSKSAPRYHVDFKLYLAYRHVKKEVKDLVFGYGPLEDLLSLPTISEIMVVDSDHIYVEKQGRIENSGRRFLSDEVTESIIERIVSQVGRTIDKSRPLVDARLSDGSRVNAVIAPIAFSGPCLTIRKFSQKKLVVKDLIRFGALTEGVAEFLRGAVVSRQNILISGGTGTGKTTLLNVMSDFIPDNERIVTIEDTVELRLSKEHVVQLETKEANLEGKGAYSIRDLVRNALRMRPDRIVVGECRGAEALDMLQAMNTGHDGSLTTIHANSAEDVVLRLEVMVQMAFDLPTASVHRQIASAVNLIVQLHRLRDGRRIVSQVAEVVGLNPLTGRVEMRDLFAINPEHDAADKLLPTGHLPSFMSELVSRKLINEDLFYR